MVYRRLTADLRLKQLNASPDILPNKLVELFEANFDSGGSQLRAIVTRCEQVAAGLEISESEMVALIISIDQFRRDSSIVGY